MGRGKITERKPNKDVVAVLYAKMMMTQTKVVTDKVKTSGRKREISHMRKTTGLKMTHEFLPRATQGTK